MATQTVGKTDHPTSPVLQTSFNGRSKTLLTVITGLMTAILLVGGAGLLISGGLIGSIPLMIAGGVAVGLAVICAIATVTVILKMTTSKQSSLPLIVSRQTFATGLDYRGVDNIFNGLQSIKKSDRTKIAKDAYDLVTTLFETYKKENASRNDHSAQAKFDALNACLITKLSQHQFYMHPQQAVLIWALNDLYTKCLIENDSMDEGNDDYQCLREVFEDISFILQG